MKLVLGGASVSGLFSTPVNSTGPTQSASLLQTFAKGGKLLYRKISHM